MISNDKENITPTDENGKAHGYWKGFWEGVNGTLICGGEYIHGKQVGLWLYTQQGHYTDKQYFI